MADFNDTDRCGELHSSEFGTFNTLGVTVATNGYQGGDSGHGGRTYLSFEDLCSTDIDAAVTYGQDTESIECAELRNMELSASILIIKVCHR